LLVTYDDEDCNTIIDPIGNDTASRDWMALYKRIDGIRAEILNLTATSVAELQVKARAEIWLDTPTSRLRINQRFIMTDNPASFINDLLAMKA
jgi:hypothetical protein